MTIKLGAFYGGMQSCHVSMQQHKLCLLRPVVVKMSYSKNKADAIKVSVAV